MKTLKTIMILTILSLVACQSLKPKTILVYEEPNYCEHDKQEDCIRFENY
jgi:hypothetical protein